MDIQAWQFAATIFALILGAVVGSVAIVAVSLMAWRKQVLGAGAIVLSIVGLLSLGFSVWQSVDLALGPIRFQANRFVSGEFKTKGKDVIIDGKLFPGLFEGPTQISFWTPSARTKEPSGKAWKIVASDERLNAFADKLIEAKVIQGYRRYEVTGAGLGARQVGMWWVSTTTTDFNLRDFLREYADFWQPGEDSTYMEILPLKMSGYPGESKK